MNVHKFQILSIKVRFIKFTSVILTTYIEQGVTKEQQLKSVTKQHISFILTNYGILMSVVHLSTSVIFRVSYANKRQSIKPEYIGINNSKQ